MNWLERARREISDSGERGTANTAVGHPTAVTAVPAARALAPVPASIGSNGSAQPACSPDSQDLRDAYEERAAILEYDAGLSREEAERAAWTLVYSRSVH